MRKIIEIAVYNEHVFALCDDAFMKVISAEKLLSFSSYKQDEAEIKDIENRFAVAGSC